MNATCTWESQLKWTKMMDMDTGLYPCPSQLACTPDCKCGYQAYIMLCIFGNPCICVKWNQPLASVYHSWLITLNITAEIEIIIWQRWFSRLNLADEKLKYGWESIRSTESTYSDEYSYYCQVHYNPFVSSSSITSSHSRASPSTSFNVSSDFIKSGMISIKACVLSRSEYMTAWPMNGINRARNIKMYIDSPWTQFDGMWGLGRGSSWHSNSVSSSSSLGTHRSKSTSVHVKGGHHQGGIVLRLEILSKGHHYCTPGHLWSHLTNPTSL